VSNDERRSNHRTPDRDNSVSFERTKQWQVRNDTNMTEEDEEEEELFSTGGDTATVDERDLVDVTPTDSVDPSVSESTLEYDTCTYCLFNNNDYKCCFF